MYGCGCAARSYLCRYYEILDVMIASMTRARVTDSLSESFIAQMIPHHRAAIRMSENLLSFSDWAPLADIAGGIISEQTKSIENMESVCARCSELKSGESVLRSYCADFSLIAGNMFSRMRCARATGNINADFMREMIPHHRGAVEMSRSALKYGVCSELVPILDKIISSQCEGISRMEALLKTVC